MSLSYTLLVPCEISLDPIALLHNYNPVKAHWIFFAQHAAGAGAHRLAEGGGAHGGEGRGGAGKREYSSGTGDHCVVRSLTRSAGLIKTQNWEGVRKTLWVFVASNLATISGSMVLGCLDSCNRTQRDAHNELQVSILHFGGNNMF